MDSAVTVTKATTGPGSESTNLVSSGAAKPEGSRRSKAARGSESAVRRSRVEMTRVDLWSVLKVSLCFYLAGLAMLLIAGLVVWLLLDASGGIHNFERFMGDIMSAKDYRLVAPQILLGSALIGLVVVALMTIITVIAAALYNVFSDLVGGVEVTLVEAQ